MLTRLVDNGLIIERVKRRAATKNCNQLVPVVIQTGFYNLEHCPLLTITVFPELAKFLSVSTRAAAAVLSRPVSKVNF